MNPELRHEAGEEPLKGVVDVRETGLWMVVGSPQKRHLAPDVQVCARRLERMYGGVPLNSHILVLCYP